MTTCHPALFALATIDFHAIVQHFRDWVDHYQMPLQDHDVLWRVIGFAGIGTFGTRFLIQWIHSERHKESRVPPIFWWQSLIGTFLCLAYFLRQHEPVGVAGYLLNVIPYSRNIVLVYRRKREARGFTVG